MEVASNLQKARGYVNDGTCILNEITLDQLQDFSNKSRVISFYVRSQLGAIFYFLTIIRRSLPSLTETTAVSPGDTSLLTPY